jgi:hypothetical protein
MITKYPDGINGDLETATHWAMIAKPTTGGRSDLERAGRDR